MIRSLSPRITIALLAGAIITVLIAWASALLASGQSTHMIGMQVDPQPFTPEKRSLYVESESTRTLAWRQLSVKAMTSETLNGRPALSNTPAWASLGPRLSFAPWRMLPSDMSTIGLACSQFASWPARDHPWPWWLPPLPSSDQGLLSYGGRASGWPFFTMRSTSTLEEVGGQLRWRGSLRIIPASNYPLSKTRDPQAGCVPLLPIPANFAASTAVFAALTLLLLTTPGAFRHHLRLRRGHCPSCGYDIQHNHTAPCPECGHNRSTQANPSVPSVSPW